jgi:hypothetical protein
MTKHTAAIEVIVRQIAELDEAITRAEWDQRELATSLSTGREYLADLNRQREELIAARYALS